MNQVECHPNWPQLELDAWLRARGVVLACYAPLGNPVHKPHDGRPNPMVLKDPSVAAAASALGATPAQTLLAWGLQKDRVLLAKSVSAARLKENLAAVGLSALGVHAKALDAMPRMRMFNPKTRPGGKPVFADERGAGGEL